MVIAAVLCGGTVTPAWAGSAITLGKAAIGKDTGPGKSLQELAGELSKQLGREVHVHITDSIEKAIQAYRNDNVQLLWLPPLAGMRARSKQPGRIVAKAKEPGYTYLIAHRSTNLIRSDNFPQSIAGLSFLFGPENAYGDRLVAEYFLRDNFAGFEPRRLFSHIEFSSGPQQTFERVVKDELKLGAITKHAWQTLMAEQQIDNDAVRIIWQTPAYPKAHWLLRQPDDTTTDFESFSKKVQKALIGIKNPELLAPFHTKTFVAAGNKDYESFFVLAQELELLE